MRLWTWSEHRRTRQITRSHEFRKQLAAIFIEEYYALFDEGPTREELEEITGGLESQEGQAVIQELLSEGWIEENGDTWRRYIPAMYT